MTVAERTRPNPYVGPRPFEYGETLYGRDREVLKLLDLLMAERIVLVYSPSGAGKTSLIQAALVPRLEEEGFRVLPIMRVRLETALPAGNGRIPPNRYVLSALLSLEEPLPAEQRMPLAALAGQGLCGYLEQRAAGADPDSPELLIFDQFEEILTVDPTNLEAKAAFFAQVGVVLRDRRRWALFSMREDYLAGLDPYLRALPTRLSTTFRLDLLGEGAARRAIQEPARQAGADFTDPAAKKLIGELRRVQVQRPDGTMEDQLGPYVEPVQLQVVCRRLWSRLSDDCTRISERDVEAGGDVDTALADYYAERVGSIAAATRTPERAVREWFDRHLITEHGVRGQVLQSPGQSEGLDNAVIRQLVDAHVVRADERRGTTWFELAHDRLIKPVRANNAAWFRANLSPLQQQAALWEIRGRSKDLLLRDQGLAEAERWARDHPGELTADENDFLVASQEAQAAAEREIRHVKLLSRMTLFAMFVSFIAFTIGIVAIVAGLWAYTEKGKAEKASEDAKSHQKMAEKMKQKADTEKRNAQEQKTIAEKASKDAVKQAKKAEEQKKNAELQKGIAVAASVKAKTQQDKAELASARARKSEHKALRAEADSKEQAYQATVALTHRYIDSGVGLMEEGDLLGALGPLVEALVLDHKNLYHKKRKPVEQEAMHRYRLAWLLVYSPRLAHLWAPPERDAAIVGRSADLRRVVTTMATSGGRNVKVWDTTRETTGDARRDLPLVSFSVPDPGPPSASLSANGRYLATTSPEGAMHVWDIAKRKPMVLPDAVRANFAIFSPDGARLLVGGSSGVRMWRLTNGVATAESMPPAMGDPQRAEFSPDGREVVIGLTDSVCTILRAGNAPAPTAKWRKGWGWAISDDPSDSQKWQYGVGWVGFSPDSRVVFAASGFAGDDHNGAAAVWDARSGKRLRPPLEHLRGVLHAVVSPDGTKVATGGHDGTARVWDLASQTEPSLPMAHRGPVSQVCFSRDGKWLATGSYDSTARVWDASTGRPITPPLPNSGPVRSVSFSGDGRYLLTADVAGVVRWWDVRSFRRPVPGPDRETTTHHQGRGSGVSVATSYDDQVFYPPDRPSTYQKIIRGDGEHTEIWEADRASPSPPPYGGKLLYGFTQRERSACFSPDGKRMLTWNPDLCDSDGKFSARVWELDQGKYQPRGPRLIHSSNVWQAHFSPDGTKVVTGSNGFARVWEASTGKPLTPPLPMRAFLGIEVWFSPDGRRVLSSVGTVESRIWDAATGYPLTPSLIPSVKYQTTMEDGEGIYDPKGNPGIKLTDSWLGSEGRSLVTSYVAGVVGLPDEPNGGLHGHRALVPVAGAGDMIPTDLPLDALKEWAQVLTSHRIDDSGTGNAVPLNRTQLLDIWRRLCRELPQHLRHPRG
jgi:WD40 repeat protein